MRILIFIILFSGACSDIAFKNNRTTLDGSRTGEDTLPPHEFYFYSLAEQYGKPKTLTALYFTKKSSFSEIFQRVDSLELMFCQLESFFEQNRKFVDSTFRSIEKFYQNSKGQVSVDSVKVKTWLENDVLLSSSLAIKADDVFFNQIIAELPATKTIITGYLQSPRQYWGSLDENTSCKIYYDVLLYLTSKDQQERRLFFKEYFKRILKD
jgi:hypothetical protein